MNKKTLKEEILISIVVVGSYFLKASVKLITGLIYSIPPLIADGLHGLIDIAEHGFLVLGGKFSRKSAKDKYPIDRQPLLDLLGMIIFGGLLIFGLSLVVQAIQVLIGSLLYFGWMDKSIANWIVSENKTQIISIKTEYLLIASFVMFFSFLLSEFVFRYENRFAEKTHRSELKADAMELRGDGLLELSLGISLIITWGLNLLLKNSYENSHLDAISAIFIGFITIGLGVYLIIIAIPEFYENYKNLMNQAIKQEKRTKLENEIEKRLPEHCNIIKPIVGYHRGDQLFIKGHIQIDRNLMQSSDVIISNCEKLSKVILSEPGKDIFTQFSPIFNWSEKIIIEDLNIILTSIFNVDVNSSYGEAFRSMKLGKLNEALNLIKSSNNYKKNEELLSIFILGECHLQMLGVSDSKTIEIASQIENKLLTNDNEIYNSIFLAWLLIYYTKLSQFDKHIKDSLISLVNDIEKLLNNNNQPDYVMAELYFSLGFFWERRFDYDLNKCRQLYKKSEFYYSKSGIRSEIDRLVNTLGHLETLLYSLGDAELHLNLANEIREIKQDKLGLAYTYGSLGDLRVKMGLFDEALFYYEEDIKLLIELNFNHLIPSLNVKKGELLIRKGVIEKDTDNIWIGINLCKDSKNKLSDPFFAKKGIIKGYLCLLTLDDSSVARKVYINEITNYLNSLEPKNSYQEAFYNRLKGRYDGMIGNCENAKSLLQKSSESFHKMRDPLFNIFNGIQEIVSLVEVDKWELYSRNNKSVNSIKNLEDYLQSLGGLLGGAKITINELVEGVIETKNKTKEELIKKIDLLIWHLEG
ncbi:MAG: cation transporter [Ignavibacteriae bacterium]|nr:cation transporter [Ignavibacteriota bacterium]